MQNTKTLGQELCNFLCEKLTKLHLNWVLKARNWSAQSVTGELAPRQGNST